MPGRIVEGINMTEYEYIDKETDFEGCYYSRYRKEIDDEFTMMVCIYDSGEIFFQVHCCWDMQGFDNYDEAYKWYEELRDYDE